MIQESLEQNIDLIINLKDNIKGSINRSTEAITVLTNKLNNLESRWKEIARARTSDANKERRLIGLQIEQINKQIKSEKELITMSKDMVKVQKDITTATNMQSIAVDRNIKLTDKRIKQATSGIKDVYEAQARGSKAMEYALSRAHSGEGITKYFEAQSIKEQSYLSDMDKLRQYYSKQEYSQRMALLDRFSKARDNSEKRFRRDSILLSNWAESERKKQLKEEIDYHKLSYAEKLKEEKALDRQNSDSQSQRMALLDRFSKARDNSEKRFRRDSILLSNWAESERKKALKEEIDTHNTVMRNKRTEIAMNTRAENKTATGAWKNGTTFGHKLVTTGQYMAAGTLLYGGASAALGIATKIATATAEADLSARTMSAVLDVSLPKAQNLESEVRKLGETFGGSLESIDQVALSLGRAGIAMTDIVPATKVVLAMARLTGDTFEESASAIISFQQVYGNTTTIESLGNKLAYVANVSRLSTQDIGTFSNYALAASKSVGMTENAVGGLAAAFSNAGINASTIGTQIRRFTTLLTDDSEAVTNFFDTLGINQRNLMASLQKGGKESDKALMDFVDTLKRVDKTTFNNLVGQMDILAANSLQLMRNNSANIDKFIGELQRGVTGQLDNTRVILESYTVTFESIFNTLINKAVKAGSSIGDALSGGIREAQKGYYIAMKSITGKDSPMYDVGLVEILDSLNTQEKILANLTEGMGDYAIVYSKVNNLKKAASIGAQSQVEAIKEERAKLTKELEQAKKDSLNNKDNTNPFALDRIDITPLDRIKSLKDSIAKLDEKQATLMPIIIDENAKVVKTKEDAYKQDLQTLSTMEKQAKQLKFNTRETENFTKAVKQRITAFENSKDLDVEKTSTSLKVDIDTLGRNIKALSSAKQDVSKEIVQYNTQINEALNAIQTKSKKQISENEKTIGVGFAKELNSIIESGNVIYKLAELKKGLANDPQSTEKINIIDKLVKFEETRLDIASKRLSVETTLNNATTSTNRAQEVAARKAELMAKRQEDMTNRLKTNKSTILELESQINGEQEVSLSKAESSFRIESQLLPIAYERMLLARGTKQEKEMEAKYQEALISYYKKSIVYIDKASKAEQDKRALQDDIDVALKSQINDEEIRLGIVTKSVNAEREKLALKIQQLQVKYGDSPEIQTAKRQLDYLNTIANKKKDISTLAKEYEKDLQDQESLGYNVAKAGLQSLENSMMDFFDMSSDGWMDWHNLASSVLQDIYKQLLQQLVIKQIVSGIAGGISNYVGNASTASTYGTNIGSQQTAMLAAQDADFATGGYLPSQGFASGGKISGGSGLRDDVYLGTIGGIKTFAMGGEFVTRKTSVNPNTQSTLEYINKTGDVPKSTTSSPVSINIENNSGTPIDASMVETFQKQNANGEYERVVNIILKASKNDPRVSSLLKGK